MRHFKHPLRSAAWKNARSRALRAWDLCVSLGEHPPQKGADQGSDQHPAAAQQGEQQEKARGLRVIEIRHDRHKAGRRWTGPPSKGAPVPGMPPGPGSMPGAAVPAGPSGKRDRPSPEPGSRRGSRCTRSGGRGAGWPSSGAAAKKAAAAAAAVSTDKIRSLQGQDRIRFPSFLPSGAFFHGSMAACTLSRAAESPRRTDPLGAAGHGMSL